MATEEQWLCDLRHFIRIEKVEPCNAPKCGMARLQMETNLAALGDCGRYARMMPVSIFNSGDCLICGEALANDQQLFGTWGVFSVPAGLERFCDAVIHWSCYANWPHRAEFAKAYFDYWVDEEKHNRCWAKAFHDEQVFMTVNHSSLKRERRYWFLLRLAVVCELRWTSGKPGLKLLRCRTANRCTRLR